MLGSHYSDKYKHVCMIHLHISLSLRNKSLVPTNLLSQRACKWRRDICIANYILLGNNASHCAMHHFAMYLRMASARFIPAWRSIHETIYIITTGRICFVFTGTSCHSKRLVGSFFMNAHVTNHYDDSPLMAVMMKHSLAEI